MAELIITFDRVINDVIVSKDKIIFKNVVIVDIDKFTEKAEFKAFPSNDGAIYEVISDSA